MKWIEKTSRYRCEVVVTEKQTGGTAKERIDKVI